MIYKKIMLCFILLIVGFFPACGLKEEVVQKEAKSFISFTGEIQDAVVYIDDLDPITLNKKSNETHYEISPGKHTIIVKKSGKEVVNRSLLLGNGITREIKIP